MSRVERYSKKRKVWRKVAAVAGALALVYLGGAWYFHGHYFPHTEVGNIEIGMKTREDAREYVRDELDKYVLTVREKEGEETISAKQAGLSFSDLNEVDHILDNQSYASWPVRLNKEYRFDELHIQVDQDTLSTFVDTLKCMNPEVPEESVSASIRYNEKKKKYQIRKETIGNIVDKDHFMEGLSQALTGHLKEISLQEDTYFVQPEYNSKSEQVVAARDKLNKYLNGFVIYKDGGQTMKILKKDLSDMLSCSDDFKVTINKKKVKAYVKKHVSPTFNSLKGEIPDGITAWKVNVDKESKELIKNIKSGKYATRKPVYSQEGFDRDEYGVYRTYIDVNLGRQKMWYVEDGEVALSSDVVTGNVAAGHATAPGFFRIAYKQRDHLMVKYNSFVHYWMPYNTTAGIGFHDASWRSSFGGAIYRTNGSHGCINMPPAKAQALFGMVSSGTAVYVHW